MGCAVFKRGMQNQLNFCQKINILSTQRKLLHRKVGPYSIKQTTYMSDLLPCGPSMVDYPGSQLYLLQMPRDFLPDCIKQLSTVGIQSLEIGKKVLGSFDNLFHVYLMNGLQKYIKHFFSLQLFQIIHIIHFEI